MATLRVGGVLSGQKFEIDEQMLRYKGPYGQGFSVPRASVQAVTVDTAGMGKGKLKVVGNGAVLAEVTLPRPWAEQAQAWIMKELGL